LEDALPDIKKRVEDIKEFTKEFIKVSAQEAPDILPKLSRKGLMKKVEKRQDAEDLRYNIAELILRMEQVPEKDRPKKFSAVRKNLKYYFSENTKAIKAMDLVLAGLAKKKLPKSLNNFGDDLFKGLKKAITGDLESGHYVNIQGPVISFAYYLQITFKKEDKTKQTVFIVLSKDFNQDSLKATRLKLNIFTNKFRRPPYDRSEPATNILNTLKLILKVLEAKGFGDSITVKLDPTKYKTNKEELKKAKAKYHKVSVHKNVVKISQPERDMHKEGTVKEDYNKVTALLADAKKIFDADKRKLGFTYDTVSVYSKELGKQLLTYIITFHPRKVVDYLR
jgi:ribosomal protein S8